MNSGLTSIARIQKRALIVGALGLALTLMAAMQNPDQFFRSYLMAYVFWIGVPIGSMGLLMLYHLTGGDWGFIIRRMLEASTRTFPLMAALFLPLLLGMKSLYEWADPVKVEGDKLLQHKSVYLNVPFFAVRAAIFFGIWIGMAYLLNRWSAEQDVSDDPAPAHRMSTLSGPGLGVLGFTATFAAVDWVMSLEPHWASTIYGAWFVIGSVLTALAFMIFALRRMSAIEPLAAEMKPGHFHDLGNLMLAFVMLWAYVSFSQFLIIWSGNLPEETPFYVKRLGLGWQAIAVVLVLFHFALPFLVLLSRDVKRKMERIAVVAAWMLVIRFVDLYWVIRPAFGSAPSIHPLDFLAPIGIGGVWVGVFLWQLKGRPLLPLHNPQGDPGF